MSRIEKGADTKEELQQLKGEVIKEIGSQRKRSPWLTCSLLFVVFIVGCFGAIAWAVAATGLVTVPGFSEFAYEELKPERTVAPGVPIETVISEQVKTTLAQRLQASGGKLNDASISLVLTEQSLTGSLRSLLEGSDGATIDSSRTQVIVSPEKGFTFYLPLKESARPTAMELSVKASVKDGAIELIPEGAKIGALPIPKSVITFFLLPFIQEKLASLNTELTSFIQINELDYQEGKVMVEGTIAVKIMEVQP